MALKKYYIDAKVDVTPGTNSFTGMSNYLNLNQHIENVVEAATFDSVSADVISEKTAATGVTVDGVLLKDGAINAKYQVTDTGGAFATPVVLTAAQSGRVILCDDAAGLDFTLPAISSTEVGTSFKFLVTTTVTSNSYRITTGNAADFLVGGVLMVDFDDVYTAPQGVFLEANGTTHIKMTLNGGTTGGKAGSIFEVIAISATQWFVTGTIAGDGVLATPFST